MNSSKSFPDLLVSRLDPSFICEIRGSDSTSCLFVVKKIKPCWKSTADLPASALPASGSRGRPFFVGPLSHPAPPQLSRETTAREDEVNSRESCRGQRTEVRGCSHGPVARLIRNGA